MCFLPPNCIFCSHYNHELDEAENDCQAFNEIPVEIMSGERQHTESYPGDNGVMFHLNPDKTDEYIDYQEMRNSLFNEESIACA